jgi:hypothetical protein
VIANSCTAWVRVHESVCVLLQEADSDERLGANLIVSCGDGGQDVRVVQVGYGW